jgi:hypothetical protein
MRLHGHAKCGRQVGGPRPDTRPLAPPSQLPGTRRHGHAPAGGGGGGLFGGLQKMFGGSGATDAAKGKAEAKEPQKLASQEVRRGGEGGEGTWVVKCYTAWDGWAVA